MIAVALAQAATVATMACAIDRIHPRRHARAYAAMHVEQGAAAGVDPWLLAAIAEHETDHRHNRIGAAGELGLLQFMPRSGADHALDWRSSYRIGIVRLLTYRRHHRTRCGRGADHPWWQHWNSGYRILRAGWAAGYGSRVAAARGVLLAAARRCATSSRSPRR